MNKSEGFLPRAYSGSLFRRTTMSGALALTAQRRPSTVSSNSSRSNSSRSLMIGSALVVADGPRIASIQGHLNCAAVQLPLIQGCESPMTRLLIAETEQQGPPSTFSSPLIPASAKLCVDIWTQESPFHSNEDRWCVSNLDDFGLTLFAVFDGHGGSQAAEYCRKSAPKFVEAALRSQSVSFGPTYHEGLRRALALATRSLEDGFSSQVSRREVESGCCAVLVLCNEKSGCGLVVSSNLGDCRALLFGAKVLSAEIGLESEPIPTQRPKTASESSSGKSPKSAG